MSAAQGPPLATGQLEIRGSRLTLYADASGATDAEQTLNVGERALVRTCFGGPAVPCGSVQAGDPRISGLRVEAELSGPELPQPLELATVPGGAFSLPGFQREGEYTLENIRLVNADSGQVIALAEPSLAVLHVRRIVLTSATVRALTLEELRARGIELTQESFQAFDFAVGFAIEGQTVEIEFPVLFEGNGLAQGLSAPKIVIDDLPLSVINLVKAWKPPTIRPIRIGPAPRSGSDFSVGEEAPEELIFPLYGAIVVPGTVTFLNQFFEAQLIVANGAPEDSGVTLGRLRALARLPGNRALRLAETEPAVVPGQWVPVVGADGSQSLSPREQGSAAWVIEGLRPGTHSLLFEIEGELERPGRDPLPVRSLAQAAVEVVDARFQLTFSHPDVVRKDEEYSLFVTVTNQSLAAQNQITVEIRSASLTGAAPAAEDDPLSHTIATLRPGESSTVEFRLVSLTTGKVIATTFQSDSTNYLGTIQLRAGVGELGIPLSPATLVMPRFTSELEARSANLVRANASLLGLAYSLAVAPASLLPPGLASIQKADVERRAIDLAEAGERLFLGDGYLESLEALLLDQLGNRHPLEGFDQLRRSVSKGLRASEGLAAELRAEQQAQGLGAEELFGHLASTMSYARPFLAALLTPAEGSPLPALEAIDQPGGSGLLAGTSEEESAARRTLPFGEMYSLRADAGAESPRADLAVVGHLAGNAATTFLLRNDHGQPARARLLLLAPDGEGGFRRLDYGVLTLAAGEILAIDAGAAVADAGQGGFRPYDPLTLEPRSAAPQQSLVPLPSFRLIGARQDFYLDFSVDHEGNLLQPNRYGNGVTYLFNRPPAASVAQRPEAFAVESAFHGQAADDSPYPAASRKVGQAAFVQPNSERVVIVRYDGGLSPLLEGGAPLVEHRHALDTPSIRDAFGQGLAGPVPDPVVESSPLHVGALIGGQVKRGTGLSAAEVKVDLVRMRWFTSGGNWILYPDLAATTTTQSDGRFFFDFVESPIPDGNIKPEFFLRATVPAGDDPLTEPAEVAQVSYSVRRQNKAMVVNIALLGRGGITGRLTYLDNGAAVAGGTVEAASTLFQEQQKVAVEDDGSFRFLGLPVGPISLAGRDAQGRRVYATVEIAAPGAVADAALKIQRLGSVPPARGAVTGKVIFLRDGIEEEALGARVAVYADGHFLAAKEVGAGGSFAFTDVPAGRVALQAANFRMSRTAVYTDLMLGGEEVREVVLRIPASSPKTVVGQVWQRDAGGALVPMSGASVLLVGPGNLTHTGADGRFTLEDVPVQGSQHDSYRLQIVNPGATEQKTVELPIILAGSPDQVIAPTVIFENAEVRGTVRGRIYDPLGRPVPFAGVVLYPFAEGQAGADGSYLFENVPLGTYFVVAKVGDGLNAGKVGFLGRSETFALDRNHASPVADVAMRGSGFVKVHTRTETSTGILTPIFYRPTYYSGAAKDIVLRGSYTESSTNPNGDFEVELPLGDFVIVANNPFHGTKEIRGKLTAIGQVAEIEIVFEAMGKVGGIVLGNDGTTPVPFAEVVLSTQSLLPQTLQADEQGRFLFELVPAGQVRVEARATVGNVERVGRTLTSIRHGEERELTVVMLSQGSVTGRVLQEISPGQLAPLPNAQYFVTENAYPHRRLPAGAGNYYFTDPDGRYEVPHLFAGNVSIVARDANDVTRQGSARAEIAVDWSVVTAPDIVFRGADAVGRITFLVRDPQSGAPVADAIVRLSTGEGTVTGSDGRALFEALKVGASVSNPRKYSARVFYAPTGQAGESRTISLYQAGQDELAEIYLDQRGEVSGFLYDAPTRPEPIAGATVKLEGYSVAGRVEVLATTSGEAGDRGSFEFLGIPEGTYALAAASTETPRRAATTVALTDTSPIVSLLLYLEQVGDRYFRVDQKLRAGSGPVDLSAGVFSVKVQQGDAVFPDYSFTSLLPEASSNVFLFADVFLERKAAVVARELGGELRFGSTSTPDFLLRNTLSGGGTFEDPFRLLLPPKGGVAAHVRDADARPVEGVNVRLTAAGSSQTSATDASGKATFVGVNAGTVTVSARSLDGISSGSAQGAIVFDDDALDLTITFQPAVRATGKVFAPLPFDLEVSDPSLLSPSAAARVELVDSRGAHHVGFTDASGVYLFEGLPKGAYTISAASADGLQIAAGSGALQDPNGNLNQLPALVLDGGPPSIVHISPRSGSTGISTTVVVEIRFSEPLAVAYLPSGAGNSHFTLRKSSGGAAAAGSWVHYTDGGQQVVKFVPSPALADFTLYSLSISGSVTDRAGRRLTVSGNVGISFRTADGRGPTVLSTEPSLARPVHPEASIRADFSERVMASAEDLDGDGLADAALLEAQRLDGSWVALPAVYYLTRLDYSLQLDLPQGLEVANDSLRRRLSLSRLRDESGNGMAPWQREFRLYDSNTPTLAVAPPAGAPDGNLYNSGRYTLAPALGNLDDWGPQTPGGDIDRVEYFFADPAASTSSPGHVSRAYPFGYTFDAAYVGTGAPRPFPIWVRAVDTSNNASPVVLVDLRVLANRTPEVPGLIASHPVNAQVFYPRQPIDVTVTGVADADSSSLSVLVDLVRRDTQATLRQLSLTVSRPAAGWTALVPPKLTFAGTDTSLPEGTPILLRATVSDASHARATAELSTAIADDVTEPVVSSIQISKNGVGGLLFTIGDRLQISFLAGDGQTGLKAARITFDRTDLFPSALAVPLLSSGYPSWSSTFQVPAQISGPTEVTATVEVEDFGGNTRRAPITFVIQPANDPFAPTVRWQAPFAGALWPAEYTSVIPGAGVPLLLRAAVDDRAPGPDGEPSPGELFAVEMRGPEVAPDGSLRLSAAWLPATRISGSTAEEYQLLWHVPNGLPAGAVLEFAVRAIDLGGSQTIETVQMGTVPARKVYQGVTSAILPEDPMLDFASTDPNGPVFLLDGALLSIYPQAGGALRSLPALFLYGGGFVSSGSVQTRISRLVPVEINSLDSAVLHYPLELRIETFLGVAGGARIDGDGAGLLGGTANRPIFLPGMTGPEIGEPGYHGGMISGSDLEPEELLRVYGDPRWPLLPGLGGRSGRTSVDFRDGGGPGGGAIRLEAGDAVVRLEGELSARGLVRPRGASSGIQSFGGAGGSIALRAGRLEGGGSIDVSGEIHASYRGSGGRAAILYGELAGDFDPARQVRADGTGTVYLEQLTEASGAESGVGLLRIASGAGTSGITVVPGLGSGAVLAIDAASARITLDAAATAGRVVGEKVVLEQAGQQLGSWSIVAATMAATPQGSRVALEVEAGEAELLAAAQALGAGPVDFHGLLRYAALELAGNVKALVRDDLALGPANAPAPGVDDEAFVLAEDPARYKLRGHALEIAALAGQPEGEILSGLPVAVQYTASDRLGIVRIEEQWQPGSAISPGFPYFDTVVALETWAGRSDAGPLSLTLRARSVDGTWAERTLSWTVLPNEAPTATATPETAAVSPGQFLRVRVAGQDREGLSELRLQVVEPWIAEPQVYPLTASSTTAERTFVIAVPTTAPAGPLRLLATVTDIHGVAVSAEATATIQGGSAPTASWEFSGATSGVPAGSSLSFGISAQDPDGNLKEARIVAVEGPIELPASPGLPAQSLAGASAFWQIAGAQVAFDAEDGEAIVVSAEVEDHEGNVYPLPPLTLTTLGDHQPPQVDASFLDSVTIGTALTGWVSASDVALDRVEITFDGETTLTPVSGSFAFVEFDSGPVADRPDPGILPIEIRAYDRLGHVALLQREVLLLADGPPEATLELSSDTFDPLLQEWVIVPGSQVTVTLVGRDDAGLASGSLSVAGLVEQQEDFVFGGLADSGSITFTVPVSAATGDQMVFGGSVVDSRGRRTAAVEMTAFVTQLAPRAAEARLYLDPEPADGIYPAGSILQVVATGRTGDGRSAELSIELDGRSESASGVAGGEWVLPQVGEPTPLVLRVRAIGDGGGVEELTRHIVVAPAGGPAAEVAFACPGDGAVLPAGATFEVGLSARAASGIVRIELYRGEELLGTLAPAGLPLSYSGSIAWTLPAQPGSVALRAVVIPAAGSPAEQTSHLEGVAATTLLDPEAPVEEASLAGTAVALGPGTWTFDQQLSVAELMLLPGARITHLPSSSAQGAARPKVDLAVAGRLYVACGAAIEASGRGFEDPGHVSGGSHFGAGGLATAGSGSSLHWPRKPGGGSGGSRGGGVIWIEAAELVVDGEIASDGEAVSAQTGGGAGGSLWIRVSGGASGAGRISADGATAPGSYGSGGGGVVSLETGSLASGLRERISARGGAGSRPGGAGALVLKGSGDLVGTLIVDGGDAPGAASGPVIGLPRANPDLPRGAEGNFVTMFVNNDIELEDYIGAVIDLGGWDEETRTRKPDLLRVVDARFVADLQCPEDDPYCRCGEGGICACSAADPYCNCGQGGLCACAPEEPYCNCGLGGDCAPCPEEEPYCGCGSGGECAPCAGEDPYCNCGLGGECPLDLWGGSGYLLKKAQIAPRAEVSAYVRFELRRIDGAGADLGSFDPADLEARGFFDRITLRGHHAVALGGLTAEWMDVGGVNAGFMAGSGQNGPEVEVDQLLIRRGAALAAPPNVATGNGVAELVARRDLILAVGARVDQTAAGRTVPQGVYPAGAGQSHIGSGGGLGPASAEQLVYDNYGDPVEPGRGFAGSPAGGGALAVAADVVYLSAATELLANGGAAAIAGGSSGGALQLRTRLLVGDGRIAARGGASATRHGGGGGGILVTWSKTRGTWLDRTDACGGPGAPGQEAGGAGSVYLREESEEGGASRLILDNCGLAGPITYGIDPNFEGNLSLLGGARIVWPAEITGAGHLGLSGPITLQGRRIEAVSLTLEEGATLIASPGQTLAIRLAEDLVLASGGRIDASGAGLSASYPQVAGSAGNHIGYKGYSSPASRGMTYGSLTRPGEPGTGTAGSPGGGVLDIEAAHVRLEGAQSGLSANGQGTAGAASGGSIHLRTGHLGGDGFIEARGASGSAAGGGGGAIALEFDSADSGVLAQSRAWGGTGTLPGGAGSVFVFDRSAATHGVLRLDNGGRPGVAELPSLGDGFALTGTAGAELVTHLTAIPSFFAGHWLEIHSSTGGLKGQWRIASISGSRVTLAADGGETLALEPGDSWKGFYPFDRLEKEILASFDSEDPLRAPIVEYVSGSVIAGAPALEALKPDLGALSVAVAAALPAEASRPVAVETAEIEGIYRITVPATTFPGAPELAWVRLGDLTRTATVAWDPLRGASFLWAGEPGEILRLRAYDPRRPTAPFVLALPALAEGASSRGFGIDLEENILDLLSGETTSWLLLARGDQVELLEADLEERTIRALGALPRLHAEYRLFLREGAVGIAARGGEDGLPDAAFQLGAEGLEPSRLPFGELFTLPAGTGGRYVPLTAGSARTEK